MSAAELLDQAVVSAAAANGALSADAVGDELKNGFGVIVQSAHDGGVDGVFNAGAVKVFLHLAEVAFALFAEKIRDPRRALGYLVILGAFAVQQAHGVLFQTRKAGVAKLFFIL